MVDLGVSPLCENFLTAEELSERESFYPLEAMVCRECWFVQVPDSVRTNEIFDADYGYYSSFSTSWLEHARRYVDEAMDRHRLGADSFVLEIASNDGYLLKNFVMQGVPCLGIDPSANVAAAAAKVGVPTEVAFFGSELARSLVERGRQADLIVANNVFAHTPVPRDFAEGLAVALRPGGTVSIEFPHLLKLINECQYDTIYHEHFSYYSLHTCANMLATAGLVIVDVQTLKTHGGSLRVFVQHRDSAATIGPAVGRVLAQEVAFGLQSLETYRLFGRRAEASKHSLLKLLIELTGKGKRIAGYGAPGKGNTLLNFCGIKADLIPYTVDRNVHKHGRFLPGSRIPVLPPEVIDQDEPDYIVILPWNLTREITAQLNHARAWGAKFIVPVPTATIIE